MILEVAVFGRFAIDPAAAFLHRLTEKHDLSEAVFSSINSAIGLTSLDFD
jgi:hypothetical protein